jgi:hypothetical protein
MSANIIGLSAFLLVAGSMSLWFVRIKRVDIPRDRRGFVASWLLGAGLGIFALTEGAGWLGGVPAFFAAFAGIFFSALVYISPQKVADDAVRVGERLRDFTAIDENGNEFRVASVAGKPLLLKFFRGHW